MTARGAPKRRVRTFACALLLVAVVLSPRVWAASYLDSARLLVLTAAREGEFLRARVYDKSLAEVVRRIAEARLGAAQGLLVPAELGLAHPHLLLMLEHYERAAAAAAAGEPARCVRLQREAEDEEQLLRAILRQLGFPLPVEKG